MTLIIAAALLSDLTPSGADGLLTGHIQSYADRDNLLTAVANHSI